MNEMNPSENKNVLSQTEAFIADRQKWLQDGVEAITGSREGNPLEVFPAAGEVRANDEGLGLSCEQEIALRTAAGEFGIGGELDVKSGSKHQILEGGKVWKIDAEVAIVEGAKTILFAGSPNRTIGQDELDYMRTKLSEGVDPASSEFEAARLVAEMQDGYKPLEKEEVLPFGYDISNGHVLVTEPTEQLVKIGTLRGADVIMLRVDRENFIDDEGNSKYRNQPDSAALLGIVADVLSACGDDESSVGLNTSNTYASRVIDTVRAGVDHGREFSIGMYGRKTLADVQGKEVASPTDINQIPGELHIMALKLAQLRAELKI
jgi:hypothetical protein